MQLAELSPWLVRGAGVVSGAALGAGATRLVDLLPRRYGITTLVSAPRRSKRNVVLVVATALVCVAIAEALLRVDAIDVASAGVLFVANALIAAVVLAAAAIDFEHMILPLELTIGGSLLCVVTAPARSLGFSGSLVGAAVGFGVAYLPFLLYKKLRGKSGMGMGDAHLAILAGAWHGALGAVVVLFAAALQQALSAIVMSVTGLRYATPESVEEELVELRARAAAGDAQAKADLADDPMAAEEQAGALGMRLPLGPFLALACIEILFLRRHVVAWLTAFFAD